MDYTFWHKQTLDKPLFPGLQWSQPENKQVAGKLMIVGGNVHGFAAVAEAYNASLRAGIGVARVLMPDKIQKIRGMLLENGEFAPTNPSGSFSQKALSEWLATSHWADGVLVCGDLGRNSETAILLESFVKKYTDQLTITKDAVDYFTKSPQLILKRHNTTLVLSIAQLQQIGQAARFEQPVTFSMDLIQLVGLLHAFTEQFKLNIVVKHLEYLLVAAGGQVCSMKLAEDIEVWRVKVAAQISVWWLQNPTQTFAALSTALIDL